MADSRRRFNIKVSRVSAVSGFHQVHDGGGGGIVRPGLVGRFGVQGTLGTGELRRRGGERSGGRSFVRSCGLVGRFAPDCHVFATATEETVLLLKIKI